MSVRHILFLFYLLCMPWLVTAQSEKGKLFIRNYGFKEYRAHPQNWEITQDHRGVMYFANGMVVMEYDGVNWRLIELPEGEMVFALVSDPSGTIFVGGDQEFGYLEPNSDGELEYISLAQRFAEKIPPFSAINDVFTAPEGVYFCADEFLLRWENNDTVKIWYPKNEGSFSAFFCHGRLYIEESDSGMMYLEDDALVSLPGAKALADKEVSIMLPYDNDEILIGTLRQGLFIYNTSIKNTRAFTTAGDLFLTENRIAHGVTLSNGHIALGTLTGGIAIMDKKGSIVEIINQENGLQSTICHSLYQDRQGLLWAALDYGVSSIDVQSPISYWEDPSGVKSIISAVFRYKDILYTCTDIGVYFLNNNKLQQTKGNLRGCFDLMHRTGLPGNPDEQLLAGTAEGIYKVEKERSEKASNIASVYKLAGVPEDSSIMLAGNDEGVYVLQYQDKKWIEQYKLEGLNNSVHSISNDKKGGIWVDHRYDGLRKIVLGEDGMPIKISRYDSLQGLPDTGEMILVLFNNAIRALTPSGIYAHDEATDRFYPDSSFGKKYTDGSKGVFRFTEDLNDNVWIFGYDNNDEGYPHLLTLEMGVKQEDNRYAFTDIPFKRLPEMLIYDFLPEEDGIVWMGTSEGLYRFDTKVEKNYDVDFNTLIREVTVANDSAIFYGTNYTVNTDKNSPLQRLPSPQQPEALQPVLKYAENSIIFDFAAPSFEDEAANRFSYYLEGYDKQWSAWSAKPEKEYTNLPYGDYTFKVKAKNIYDLEGATALYSFTILPPWYRTYWAYALYVIAFFFLLYSGIQLFTRKLQAQNVRLEREKAQQQEFSSRLIVSQENERKRIAAELHDGVNQSLVLIKNKLYMLLNPEMDRNAVEERVKTLTDDVGQTMDEVRGVSYGLRPFQLDQLGLSKSLEALAGDASQATRIAFKTDIDNIDDLFPKDQEINIYRVVQECINNIIRHSGASEAGIDIKQHKKEVQMRITDNGKGFDTKKTNLKTKSGFGMMGIRERIRFLGGSLHIVSDPGKGSVFSISLPIKNSWTQSGLL